MAFDNTLDVSLVGHFVAAVDLSAAIHKLVILDATMKVALPAAQGDRVIGVLKNAPKAGEVASVCVYGFSRVVADEAVALAAGGARVTPAGTNGRAEPAAAGDFVAGYLVEASGAADELVTMFVNPSQVPLA